MIIVAGPPCSGKTTYVRQRALSEEEVLDWDTIYTELAGEGPRPAPVGWNPLRQATETEFRRRWEQQTTGWVIRCAPNNRQRSFMRDQKQATSVVLATPTGECIRRLMLDETRPDKQAWSVEIVRWWSAYRPSHSPLETVVQNRILDQAANTKKDFG